jgi:hypothetical protein
MPIYKITLKQFLFCLSFIFIVCACKKDSGEYNASIQIGRIKGIECRDHAGDLYAIIGDPDIRLKDKTTGQPNYTIYTIPNPNVDSYYGISEMTIFIRCVLPVQHAHLWLERVSYNEDLETTEHYLGAVFIKANAHVIDQDSLALPTGDSRVYLHVSSITPGYYRAYFQINDELLWDNLAININPLIQ